jgi:hypothetical protein
MIQNQNQPSKTTIYRFDIFRGETLPDGRVQKVKSVGNAYVREGLSTYTVHLKTFLKDTFYLLQNTKSENPDFVILTREPSQNPSRKYFWNHVGEVEVLGGVNDGIMRMKWDLLNGEIYMKAEPVKVTEFAGEIVPFEQAA